MSLFFGNCGGMINLTLTGWYESWTSQRAQACCPNLGRVGHRAEGIEKRGTSVLDSRYSRSNAHFHKVWISHSFSSLRCRRAIDHIHYLKKYTLGNFLLKSNSAPCCVFPLPLAIFLGICEIDVTLILAFSISLSLTLNKIELWCVFFVRV